MSNLRFFDICVQLGSPFNHQLFNTWTTLPNSGNLFSKSKFRFTYSLHDVRLPKKTKKLHTEGAIQPPKPSIYSKDKLVTTLFKEIVLIIGLLDRVIWRLQIIFFRRMLIPWFMLTNLQFQKHWRSILPKPLMG